MTNAMVPFVQADEFETIQRTGRMLAASGYFGATGDTAQAIAQMATKILAGRELGFGPFAAVNGIHIISGRPAVGANLMASAVKAHPVYDYRVRELTEKVCRIEFFQRTGDKMESLGVSEFSAEDARKAGTKNMDKFARNMLFARAMSNGIRWYTPDVFGGNAVYVPEELGATVDGEGDVVDVTPRRVDAETLPDVDFSRAPTDNPFEDAPQATPAEPTYDKIDAGRLKHLNVLGRTLYNGGWDDKRGELVSAVTKGRSTSSKELTTAEADKLIAGLETKAQAQAQPA